MEYLLSKEGQELVGRTYLRIPSRKGVDSPYALDKLVRKEKLTPFPNKDALRTAPDSISTLAKLFGKR
jgi:ABC-type thiamine transport system substrate-binding protein